MWIFSLATLLLAGCTTQDQTGTVGIAVTDAPVDDWSKIEVTFSRGAIHRSGGENESGWVEIVNETRTVDLLALHKNQTAEALGFAEVDAGRYQQVRLYVDEVMGTRKDNTTQEEMTVPSNIIRTSKSFEVKAGGNTTLTLEIDLNQSIRCNNNRCTFSPVVGKVEAEEE